MPGTPEKLQRAANVAILVVATVTIGIWIHHFYLRPEPAAGPVGAYAPGETFPEIPNVEIRGAERSLVLFLSSTCRFCTDSMPFYQQLVSRRDSARSPVRIIALAREASETFETYLRAHRLTVDQVIALAPTAHPKLRLTPTILELDSHRVIQRAWTGAVSEQAAAQILGLVDRTAAPTQ